MLANIDISYKRLCGNDCINNTSTASTGSHCCSMPLHCTTCTYNISIPPRVRLYSALDCCDKPGKRRSRYTRRHEYFRRDTKNTKYIKLIKTERTNRSKVGQPNRRRVWGNDRHINSKRQEQNRTKDETIRGETRKEGKKEGALGWWERRGERRAAGLADFAIICNYRSHGVKIVKILEHKLS